jgi:hypothetical protein
MPSSLKPQSPRNKWTAQFLTQFQGTSRLEIESSHGLKGVVAAAKMHGTFVALLKDEGSGCGEMAEGAEFEPVRHDWTEKYHTEQDKSPQQKGRWTVDNCELTRCFPAQRLLHQFQAATTNRTNQKILDSKAQ